MGWKTINGRRYYYKSEREGGRAKSTHFGAREAGTLMVQMVAFDRLDRVAESERFREERMSTFPKRNRPRSRPVGTSVSYECRS